MHGGRTAFSKHSNHLKAAIGDSIQGNAAGACYEPDFVCYGKIIVEIKAASGLDDAFRAQVHNYLKATGFELGLLVNFGLHPKLEYERIVRSKAH